MGGGGRGRSSPCCNPDPGAAKEKEGGLLSSDNRRGWWWRAKVHRQGREGREIGRIKATTERPWEAVLGQGRGGAVWSEHQGRPIILARQCKLSSDKT